MVDSPSAPLISGCRTARSGKQLYGQTESGRPRDVCLSIPTSCTVFFMRARAKGWQLTAHAQGGGAIDTLLDAFETSGQGEVDSRRAAPRDARQLHERAAIQRMKRLDVSMDVSPAGYTWMFRR